MTALLAHGFPEADPRWPKPDSAASGGTMPDVWTHGPTLCFLDSPRADVDAAAPEWWSGNADSSSVVWWPKATSTGEESQDPMSTAEQIALVVHTLGFGKRQLAEIFGVSRQAIYDWLRGGNVRDENADRLAKLARLVLAVSGDTRRPLYHRFTSHPLADGEDSLLDLLRADRWDENRILAQLRHARTLTTQRQGRQGKERSPTSGSRRDEYLTDNLLSIGEG